MGWKIYCDGWNLSLYNWGMEWHICRWKGGILSQNNSNESVEYARRTRIYIFLLQNLEFLTLMVKKLPRRYTFFLSRDAEKLFHCSSNISNERKIHGLAHTTVSTHWDCPLTVHLIFTMEYGFWPLTNGLILQNSKSFIMIFL